jgi:predicted ester cyclase
MKKYLCAVPLVLLLCLSFACQDKAAMAELEKYKAQAKVEEQNKKLARSFIAAIDRNDFAMIKEACSADFALRAPGLTEPLNVETLIQVIQSHYAAFPDWKHTIEGIISEGNTVVMQIVQSGTHKASFEGIPPTAIKVTEPGLYIFIVDNGKVKGGYVIEDSLGLYLQLGMELKPKEAKK